MPPFKILTVVGARPQFIKAAAVSRALIEDGGFVEVILHTGQHFDDNMSGAFFRELDIPEPAYNLEISNCSHAQMTARMLEAIESIIHRENPDGMLVYGDTNSTLAGALAAAKLGVPVFHVEAGLRSYRRSMPEEINRVLTDHISDLLLCPTAQAVSNLHREGIQTGVHHIGDVMFDTARLAMLSFKGRPNIGEQLGLSERGYFLATLHRAENTVNARMLQDCIDYLSAQSKAAGLPTVMPLHPRTQKAAERFGVSLAALHVIPPLGYLDMARLLSSACCVFTDSGGLQKEAYFHSVPCVTLRDETEWPETVTHGWNRLWRQESFLERRAISDYGDGTASSQAVTCISRYLRSRVVGPAF